MPIVPYIALSEMIMIGAAPYWQGGGISLPLINQPPPPRHPNTPAPAADNRARLRPRPAQRGGDRHRHARPHRADHRGQKDLALPEADIAVHEAAEIASVGRHRPIGRGM